MDLYNPIINRVKDLLGGSEPRRYPYNPDRAWEDYGSNQLVMMRDSAFELGGSGNTSVNYSCVTSGELPFGEASDGKSDGASAGASDAIDGAAKNCGEAEAGAAKNCGEASGKCADEIIVFGPDLGEIKGDVPFARIALIKTGPIEGEDEDDTEPVFRAINDIDFVKYHVYPTGYMVRTSSDSYREQVRLDRAAISRGISFEQVGNLYIKNYKKNPNVKEVKLIFATTADANYEELLKDAKKVHDITRTLSKILEGMSTDCNSCSLKSICDEVEGLKELHFGKEAKEFK